MVLLCRYNDLPIIPIENSLQKFPSLREYKSSLEINLLILKNILVNNPEINTTINDIPKTYSKQYIDQIKISNIMISQIDPNIRNVFIVFYKLDNGRIIELHFILGPEFNERIFESRSDNSLNYLSSPSVPTYEYQESISFPRNNITNHIIKNTHSQNYIRFGITSNQTKYVLLKISDILKKKDTMQPYTAFERSYIVDSASNICQTVSKGEESRSQNEELNDNSVNILIIGAVVIVIIVIILMIIPPRRNY